MWRLSRRFILYSHVYHPDDSHLPLLTCASVLPFDRLLPFINMPAAASEAAPAAAAAKTSATKTAPVRPATELGAADAPSTSGGPASSLQPHHTAPLRPAVASRTVRILLFSRVLPWSHMTCRPRPPLILSTPSRLKRPRMSALRKKPSALPFLSPVRMFNVFDLTGNERPQTT